MDAIGFDSYNLCLTGRAAMSIKATRSDPEHLPCVIEEKSFSCGSFGGYEESCTCGSLRVKEPYGGGEALIVEPLTFDADSGKDGGV